MSKCIIVPIFRPELAFGLNPNLNIFKKKKKITEFVITVF
jgi:hypothetical protein